MRIFQRKKQLKRVLEGKDSPIDQKITQHPGLMGIVSGYTNPIALRADTNDELKREVDKWCNVMYRDKDEDGKRYLKKPRYTEEAKQKLLKRVGHISDWDVSKVTDMSYLFSGKHLFNHDISRWDVSKVKNMSHMFSMAWSFDKPLNNWDVSNVTNMSKMFYLCCTFNKPLNNWVVSNVRDMKEMFWGTRSLNRLNLLPTWYTKHKDSKNYKVSIWKRK